MEQDLLDQVRGIVATIFNTPLSAVTAETSATSLPKWDSMGHLTLILQLEQEFDVRFEPEEVETMNSVARVVAALVRARTAPRIP